MEENGTPPKPSRKCPAPQMTIEAWTGRLSTDYFCGKSAGRLCVQSCWQKTQQGSDAMQSLKRFYQMRCCLEALENVHHKFDCLKRHGWTCRVLRSCFARLFGRPLENPAVQAISTRKRETFGGTGTMVFGPGKTLSSSRPAKYLPYVRCILRGVGLLSCH